MILAIKIASAGVFDPSDLGQAYTYLNQLRARAGLTEFLHNPQLEIAALNHANYLANNIMTGHNESQGLFGFTGVSPKDRVVYSGYSYL